MMHENASTKNEIICHCTCTTKAEILALIQKGADTVEKIAYKTGTTAGCGGCEDLVKELLMQYK